MTYTLKNLIPKKIKRLIKHVKTHFPMHLFFQKFNIMMCGSYTSLDVNCLRDESANFFLQDLFNISVCEQ